MILEHFTPNLHHLTYEPTITTSEKTLLQTELPQIVLSVQFGAVQFTEYGVNEFWVGHYGDFDHYAAKAVRELKQEYNVELVLVIPYLTKEIDEYKVDYYKNFDAIIMADIPEKTPTKLRIIKANQYMVNESDYLICYVKNFWGGAAKTLEYAKKRNI